MDIEKTIKNYTKIYRKALVDAKMREINDELTSYESRLREMYASDNFKRHSNYPSTNAVHVYAVIAMCLGLKQFDLTDPQIIDIINSGFSARRNFFRRLLRCIDMMPNAYQIHDKKTRGSSGF